MRGGPRRVRSVQGRGTILVGLLILDIGASIATIAATFAESRVLERYRRGQLLFADEIVEAIDRSTLFARIGLGIFVVSGIVWMIWQHRGQANLHALRIPRLRFTPGWAVGWWLIPVANLFKPFQTVRELWKASDPSPEWRSTRTWPVIGWWWAGWIVANVIGRIALALFRDDAVSVEPLLAGNRWLIAGEIVRIVTAILAIMIVRSVIDRQAVLPAARVAQAGGMPPRPDATGSTADPVA